MSSLSPKDAKVFDLIFNPEVSVEQDVLIDARLPSVTSIPSPTLLKEVSEQELKAIKAVEDYFGSKHETFLRELQVSEDKQPPDEALSSAIAIFTSIISSHPGYASAYANRAQCTALKLSLSHEPALKILYHPGLLQDLQKTLDLASPKTPTTHISPMAAKILASAYTQRASLYLAASWEMQQQKMEKNGINFKVISEKVDDEWDIDAAERYEEKASQDFFWGGRYGNALAGAMVIRTNPYAKACGNIVKEALRKEIEGSASNGLVKNSDRVVLT